MRASRWLWWLSGLGLLPIVTAQSSLGDEIAKIPNCALDCFMKNIPTSSCTMTNQTCLCTDQRFIAEMTACVRGGCPVVLALQTQNITMSLCNAPIRDKSQFCRILLIVALGVGSLCALQRFVYKYIKKIGLGADDWVFLLMGLSAYASAFLIFYGLLENGFGHDLYTLTPDQITTFLQHFHTIALLYFIQINLLKISLLFFYLRIFPTQNVRYLLWGTIIFCALVGATYALIITFICWPMDFIGKGWDGEHRGKCLNLDAVSISGAISSIVLDIWILVVPLSQLKSLALDWKNKLLVASMFAIGTFITIVSTLRLRSALQFRTYDTNPTWNYMPIITWSIIEIFVGSVCTCMPSIRMLFADIFFHRSDGKSSDQVRRENQIVVLEPHQNAMPLRNAVRRSLYALSSFIEVDDVALVQDEFNQSRTKSDGSSRYSNALQASRRGNISNHDLTLIMGAPKCGGEKETIFGIRESC